MLGHPTPVLRSFDETRARAFYIDFLGFVSVFEHRSGPGSPVYLGVKLGDCALHLSEHYGDGSPGAAVRIPVDDVVAYAQALRDKAFGNACPGEPEKTPWGTREVTIADPAGNRLTFFTEMANFRQAYAD